MENSRVLMLLLTTCEELSVSMIQEFQSCQNSREQPHLGFLKCDQANFFSSQQRASSLRRCYISAPDFIQFGGRFGWRRFRRSRLRHDFAAAPLFCSERSYG